jgi:hypothetical protein
MLDSLQKTINNAVQVAEEWDLAHPNPSNKVPFRALVGEHKTCKMLLDNFRKGSEKYLQSILNGRPKGYHHMKREWAKMMWHMFHSNDAATLGRNLTMHVMAINMYSEQLRWYVSFSTRRCCSYRFIARYSKTSQVPLHRHSQLWGITSMSVSVTSM